MRQGRCQGREKPADVPIDFTPKYFFIVNYNGNREHTTKNKQTFISRVKYSSDYTLERKKNIYVKRAMVGMFTHVYKSSSMFEELVASTSTEQLITDCLSYRIFTYKQRLRWCSLLSFLVKYYFGAILTRVMGALNLAGG